jgi:hypothetical protein
MASNKIDLLKLFQTVTSNLSQNQENLNQADTFNHDHGDHMVEIFQVITQAMQEKKGSDPADQLAYASQLLRNKKSGSAQLYAQNLSNASQQFSGKSITPDNVGLLLQSLLGGQAPNQSQQNAPANDPLSAILGGLTGGQNQAQDGQPSIDANDLLNAGLAFMQAKQGGSTNLEAAVNALVSSSAMGNSDHRSQSGALVANSVLQLLGSMSKGK